MARDDDSAESLWLGGRAIPLIVKRSPRARRVTMTVDHTRHALRLVLPRRTSLREGLGFCRRHEDWVVEAFAALPARVPFAVDRELPLLGEAHRIAHRPEARRGVWCEAGCLLVSGRLEFLPRRVESFVRDLARREFESRARDKTRLLGRPARRVVLRESRTRWGSCSPDGDLSFCWRLVFAPPTVLDYVVAHEVAHLRHMNHGARFWALVAELTAEVAAPRRWLVENGANLWRYG